MSRSARGLHSVCSCEKAHLGSAMFPPLGAFPVVDVFILVAMVV